MPNQLEHQSQLAHNSSTLNISPAENLGAIISTQRKNSFIRKILKELGPEVHLLDFGCGSGGKIQIYKDLVRTVSLVEVEGCPNLPEQAETYDGRNLPYASNTFDVILGSEVLEHISEPKEMLLELYRVLKPGGHLILTTPFVLPIHHIPHDYYRYTYFGLEYLLQKCKYRVKYIEGFSGPVGIVINQLIRPQLKVWSWLARKTHLSILRKRWNPFVLLGIVFPQTLYVMFSNQKGNKLIPMGYGTFAQKILGEPA